MRAASACPRCPRSAWMRSSKGVSLPRQASTESAPATSAAANTRSPAKRPASESAVEQTTLPKGSGSYYVVVVPFATGPIQSYDGLAKMAVKHRLSIKEVNRRAPKGQPNYRASHDRRST